MYGGPPSNPIREDGPLRSANPYGRSKRMIEEVLRDADRHREPRHGPRAQHARGGARIRSGPAAAFPFAWPIADLTKAFERDQPVELARTIEALFDLKYLLPWPTPATC